MNMDPELQEMLARVLSHPRCSLPQHSKDKILSGIADDSLTLADTRTRLSSAERHLLQYERYELEDALYRLSIAKLLDDRQTRSNMIAGSAPALTLDMDDCERRLEEGFDARIQAWRHGFRLRELSAVRVLSLCLLLRNDPTTRILLACGMAEEQPLSRDPERLLLGTLSTPLADEVRQVALINLGFVYSHSGRPAKAFETYSSAARRFPNCVEAVFGALRNAMALGDEAAAKRLADHLADIGRTKIPILISNVRALPLEARAAITQPGKSLARSMSSKDSRIGDLLHEIAQL